jgi:hypothetical protein
MVRGSHRILFDMGELPFDHVRSVAHFIERR